MKASIVVLFLLSLPAVATRIHSADEIEYFSLLRSVWFDRDLSFDNEYRYFFENGFTTDPGFKATFLDAETATGLRPTFATIGCALLWAPFYGAADVVVRVARLLGSTVPADGFSWPYLAAAAYGSACYGVLALIIAAAVARRVAGHAAAAAVAAFAGTPFVFYMYAMPMMAHACSAFAVAAFVWIWFRVRETWSLSGVAALASAGALMAMVREQEAFVVVAPAVDYAWTRVGRGGPAAVLVRDAAARLVLSAAVFSVTFLPQALAYVVVNGHLGPSPVVADKMYWTAPWAMAVLASPEHGWFFWTPLAGLGLAGLIGMIARPGTGGGAVRRTGLLLVAVVVTQVYVSGSVASWTLAGAFGQRRFIGMTVCVVAGLAWLLARWSRGPFRLWLRAVVVLAVWWNLGLAVQFGEHSMDRQRLTLARNAYATFVELPGRLPAIAYRYLFDRTSFYESSRTSSGG